MWQSLPWDIAIDVKHIGSIRNKIGYVVFNINILQNIGDGKNIQKIDREDAQYPPKVKCFDGTDPFIRFVNSRIE